MTESSAYIATDLMAPNISFHAPIFFPVLSITPSMFNMVVYKNWTRA
jgi:hypothetical protein